MAVQAGRNPALCLWWPLTRRLGPTHGNRKRPGADGCGTDTNRLFASGSQPSARGGIHTLFTQRGISSAHGHFAAPMPLIPTSTPPHSKRPLWSWRIPRALRFRHLLGVAVAATGLWVMGGAFSSSAPPAAGALLPGYQLTLAHPLGAIARNLSGLTYSRDTGTLYAVINRPAGLAEISTSGQVLRHFPHIAGLHDIEGIAHVQGDVFAVVEEASNRVRWLQVPAQGAPRLLPRPPLQLPEANFANLGLEGLAWDAAARRLLLVQERWPTRVLSVGDDGVAHTSAIETEGHLEASDLSSIERDPRSGHVLLLSDESATVYEHAATGELLARLPLQAGQHGLSSAVPQAEGMALDDHGRLYIVSEPNLFYRFERGAAASALAHNSVH